MINYLINNNKIEIFFQPIVSIKDKKIFAYEALTRAYDENNQFISPLYLFDKAKEENLSCLLDNYVRELALKKFQSYYKNDNDVLLFLNIEASIIDSDEKDEFISLVSHYKIPTSNIVIEIKEDQIENSDSLKDFVARYKEEKFIIAIDDFGTGYSSFDRLEFIKPDIVKIDRSLIYNIHENFINSEILKAISNMCQKIGAMVLGEGVEHRDEVLSCLKKDIDIFQGFWFCKPQKEIDSFTKDNIIESVDYISNRYRSMIKQDIHKKKELLSDFQDLTQKVLSVLEHNSIEDISRVDTIVLENSKLEAIYIIDEESGLQVGKTVIHSKKRALYTPTKDKHDHSLSEYYFLTKESSRQEYLSCKYISKASGNMCRTYSSSIIADGFKYIVCFDILE